MVQKIVNFIGQEPRKHLEFKVCPMKSNISYYACGILALLLLVAGLTLKVVYKDNGLLIADKAKLELTVTNQKAALDTCSKNTIDLKVREDELTKNAKAEVEKANEKADTNRKAFLNLLNSKNKDPIITPENVSNYGGEDDAAKMRDYLNTQYLLNQYIDLRNSR